MVEYWNVGLNREVTHLLTSLSREILSIDRFFQELFTHYSITPVFQHSNCERSELSSIWGIAGRQEIMEMRRLWQLRITGFRVRTSNPRYLPL